MNKTSKEDFNYFKKCCDKWITILGLKEWRVLYEHDGHPDSYAYIRRDYVGRICVIGLSINWTDTKVTKDLLERSAKHEVLHLMLAELVRLGNVRQATDEDFSIAEHNIIRRLENAWN